MTSEVLRYNYRFGSSAYTIHNAHFSGTIDDTRMGSMSLHEPQWYFRNKRCFVVLLEANPLMTHTYDNGHSFIIRECVCMTALTLLTMAPAGS